MHPRRLPLIMIVVMSIMALFNASAAAAATNDHQAATQIMQNLAETAPIVEYSTPALSVRENTSSVIVTVLLRSASSDTTSVNYTTSDGTATAGIDYTATSGTLTFAPGETSKTFTVAIQNDTADEPNEIINLSLSDLSNATLGPISTATITIEDDDIVVSVAFDLSRITVHEHVGTVNVEVELKSISNSPITVDYSTSDGTATAGSDYTATSGTLTFGPGQTRTTFSVPIAEDAISELSETIDLTLSNPTNATLGTPSSSRITISANDSLSFAGNVSVAEHASEATLTVKLNAPSSSTVSVDYATRNVTAHAGEDYTATSGTLAFAPGETIKTLTVPITDDLLGESSESFAVDLSNPTKAELRTPFNAGVTITPNDIVAFVNNVNVHENAGTATLTVKLNGAYHLPVTVDYATRDHYATAGSDYTATSGTLAFAPGETIKTLTIPILDDVSGEDNETFTVALSNPSNAGISGMSSAVVTIYTNDRVAFASNVNVHENVGIATLTVKLNAPSNHTVTVDYISRDITAHVSEGDYATVSGTLTFAPGEQSKTLTIPFTDDVQPEESESFALDLKNPNNASIGTLSNAAVTIITNDIVGISGNISVHENAGTATLTVKLNAPSSIPVSVNYTTRDVTARAGDSDYTPISGTLTFAPGELSKTLTIPILDDLYIEESEVFTLDLSNPTNAGFNGVPNAAITILPNDILGFAGNVSVHENAGTATLTVKLNGPSSLPVTVDYATRDITAHVSEDDYTATSGTLTFAPGELSKTFTVPILDDQLSEPSKAFGVALSNPTNAGFNGMSNATVTINANDTLSFSAGTYRVNENTAATITVRLNSPSSLPVTVNYDTYNIVATAGSDYTATSGTLTFAPGETSKTFTISLIDDAQDEPNETVGIGLSNPTNAGLGAPLAATLTIVDND